MVQLREKELDKGNFEEVLRTAWAIRPDFRYQLLQVLQQAERAEYADEQQQRYRFALLDVRNGLFLTAISTSTMMMFRL